MTRNTCRCTFAQCIVGDTPAPSTAGEATAAANGVGAGGRSGDGGGGGGGGVSLGYVHRGFCEYYKVSVDTDRRQRWRNLRRMLNGQISWHIVFPPKSLQRSLKATASLAY
jgi:hypothetical protein